jgi:membrane-associated phospholipid phosphatase
LACAALVLGYEQPELQKRFGSQVATLSQLRTTSARPTVICRIRASIAVLLPWLSGYGLIWLLGKPIDAVSTYLPLDQSVPILQWTEIIYASTYLVVILTPFLLNREDSLRQFQLRGLTAMLLLFPLYLLLPFFVPPRPFESTTAIGNLLLWERTPYSGAGAFPSFHVVWALVAASALGQAGRWQQILWWTWGLLVAVSCVTTGMHSLLDVVAGFAAFVLVVNIEKIWTGILAGTEWVANSWQERRIGRLRIINHGAYAGAAVIVGLVLIEAMLPPKCEALAVSIFLCATVGAAFWAQWVEGSPALLRPLGFYGGMLGAIVGAIPALFLGINLWVALAAICVAAPWIQGIGRLRCLVQGCCHGRAARTIKGIRYSHPRSRVCRLADLKGIPIHATPVYSILWNVLVGLVLLRLVALDSTSTLVSGVYLLLSGAGRFVEEAYRGEPQTRIVFGLRFYQWIAALTVILGAVVSSVYGAPQLQRLEFRLSAAFVAAGCGLIAWFVTGVDFPESSRRFARLT